MKYLYAFFLAFSFQASATTFGKYRSTPDGVASQKFIADKDVTKFEKTSNYFDLSDKDYSVGIYTSEDRKEFSELMTKVEEYSKKFQVVDEYLKTKGSSFNNVSGSPGHEEVILVNDYRIRKESKFYAELDGVFKKLRGLKWKQQKGYQVSQDLMKLMEIEDGKTIKTSPYARDLYCQRVQPPTTCTFYGGGQIYVK